MTRTADSLAATLRRVDQEGGISDGWVYPANAVAAAFIAPVTDGTEPHTAEVNLDRDCDRRTLLPDDATVIRTAATGKMNSKHHIYARTPRGGLYVSPYMVAASATTPEAAEALLADVMARVPADEDDNKVGVSTWSFGSHGARSRGRSIETPRWADVRVNYPEPVNVQLDELMARQSPPGSEFSGKLIVWYGPPGTGKTTAIRALMREWLPWCSTQYIPDPEAFFASADYMTEVLNSSVQACACGCDEDEAAERHAQKYRLIVAEDCDEFISSSARLRAGAALGRLLNLSDGILGQGSNVIVLLTTNERLRELHPALTRPGRCLAKVEFARFTADQARAWLGNADVTLPGSAPTLAELFEARAGRPQIGHIPERPAPTGLYI